MSAMQARNLPRSDRFFLDMFLVGSRPFALPTSPHLLRLLRPIKPFWSPPHHHHSHTATNLPSPYSFPPLPRALTTYFLIRCPRVAPTIRPLPQEALLPC